ncbi:MAG: LVIVD repeat-containing protein [Thermoplasmatota archaeon]
MLRVHSMGPVLLAIVAAGCLAVPGSSITPSQVQSLPSSLLSAGWAARAIPFGGSHNHTDPAQHRGISTPNFQLVGWDPLNSTLYGKPAGGYLCGNGATTAQGRRLAVVNSWTTDVAFVLVDVTNPAAPQKVGEYELKGVKTYDAAITPDGQHVVVAADPAPGGNENPQAPSAAATDPFDAGVSADTMGAVDSTPFTASPVLSLPSVGQGPTMSVSLLFRDACTGRTQQMGPEEQLPIAPGVFMVGVADPKNPTFEDFQPTPALGPHSVSTSTVDNTTYVIGSTTNLAHDASYFSFYTVTKTPAGAKLLLDSVITSGENQILPPGSAPLVNGHVDATIFRHPVTGKLTAYLDDWDGGFVIVDMSNLHAPQILSTWLDPGPEGGNIHSSIAIQGLWNGRHYAIVGQEFTSRPSNRPTGWIHIIDDTNPAKPNETGRWTLPVDTQANWGQNELFSTHYFNLVNRTLFVSMYHGGVWAVDLSNQTDLAMPRTIGVYIPANAPANPPKVQWTGQIRGWPYVLDVVPFPADGTITIFDSTSGAYDLRFNPHDLPPLLPEWPANGRTHES